MYDKGEGIPGDYKTAKMAYELAARQGNSDVQFLLDDMYYEERGVLQDNVYVHMWWNSAASSGDNPLAFTLKGRIGKRMTLSQIGEAQNFSRNFVPRKSFPTTTTQKPSPRSNPDKVISASPGSGFAVSDDGHVITNNHVIKGCNKVKIHHKGKRYPQP